jgi:predicted RNA-binding protein with PUA-like domain
MNVGDLCLYYHSNEGKEVVGIAQVTKEAYQDPTTSDPNWVVVDVKPYKKLLNTVSLETLKSDERLSDLGLLRQPRLSVIALTENQFNIILELANEK